MPGSLLSSPRARVTRHESTRSDRSDGSACSNNSQSSNAGKKVSFNKAVRVKKYPRPKKNTTLSNGDIHPNGGVVNGVESGTGSPEKRFWFRVYKNKHRQAPDPNEFRTNDVIYYGNDVGNGNGVDDDVISYHPNPSSLNYPVLTSECGTQTLTKGRKSETSNFSSGLFGGVNTPLHPSQMPTDPPHVKRNYVKKIVNRFNEDAVLTRQRSSEGDISPPVSPPSSPRHHSTPIKAQAIPPPPPEPPVTYSTKQQSSEGTLSSRFKKNPIVNGVKVIFGMAQLKRRDKDKIDPFDSKNHEYAHKSQETDTCDLPTVNGSIHNRKIYPYKTEIIVSDGSETDVKTPYGGHNKINGNGIGSKINGNGIGSKTHYGEVVKTNNGELIPRADDAEDEYGYYFDDEDDDSSPRRGKYHVETWDTGNELVFDTTDVNTATAKTDKGQFMSTVGEKHQMWRNNKRIVVYEEPSPRITRRKAKSQNDLTNPEERSSRQEKVDKGVSTEQLSSKKYDDKTGTMKKSKDSWLKNWRSSTKDKGIQCNKVPTSDGIKQNDSFGKYKIIRPRNGIVSAYSNVPSLNKLDGIDKTISNQTDEYSGTAPSSAIYSQVDKSKKKKNGKDKKKSFFSDENKSGGLFKSRSEPLYIGPPPKNSQQNPSEDLHDSFYEDRGDRKVKTFKRSFGFRLNTGRDEDGRKGLTNGKSEYREENWYDVDDDVEAVEMLKGRGHDHHDISEVRQEIADDEFISDISSLHNGDHRDNGEGAGSVMREVDYKKREISYENVHRPDGESNQHPGATVGSGLWFRDAEDDYRREMAQSEVSYPAGNHVGSDRFYTLDRSEKSGKRNLLPPGPRAYTLDRRHLKEKQKVNNTSGVKILVNGKEVNGKEVNDRGSVKKTKSHHRKNRSAGEDPSSVQSDPLYVRGGLAAAYQARQRAAVRRSNSSVAGIGSGYRTTSPGLRRRVHGSSEVSGASSESESAHQRRPLVMYIPGISHQERSLEDGDRTSGTNVARSQSMMTSTRPPRITPRQSRAQKNSKSDLYRSVDFYEEDEIMPLASDMNKKKPPKVPRTGSDSKKQADIKRRHSMPKDTKFSWLKWRIRGKPSREP